MTDAEKMTPEERAREVATALSGITRYEGKGDEQDTAIIAQAIRKAVEGENMACRNIAMAEYVKSMNIAYEKRQQGKSDNHWGCAASSSQNIADAIAARRNRG